MRKNNENWKRAYNKLAEEFFALQHEFDVYRFDNPETELDVLMNDPWAGCACGSSSTCGTTFTTDKSGVTVDNSKDTIDYPPYEGRYTVLVKKETN